MVKKTVGFIFLVWFGVIGCTTPELERQATLQRYIGNVENISQIITSDTHSSILSLQENETFHSQLDDGVQGKESIFSLLFKDKILYIRVTFFTTKIAKELTELIAQYKDIRGIILDLRNNGGGVFQEAIKVSDLFLEKGMILRVVGKTKRDTQDYYANSHVVSRLPLAVLVNKHSISASEIVAGVLQERQRAIIIGQKTFGKSTIQDVVQITKKRFLKFTVARYYFPSGKSIERVGVTPDIQIDNQKVVTLSHPFLNKQVKQKIFEIKKQNIDLYIAIAQRVLTQIDK